MRLAYGNLTLIGCGAVAAGRLGNAKGISWQCILKVGSEHV